MDYRDPSIRILHLTPPLQGVRERFRRRHLLARVLFDVSIEGEAWGWREGLGPDPGAAQRVSDL